MFLLAGLCFTQMPESTLHTFYRIFTITEMATIPFQNGVLIFVFCILVPTLDQFSDINMASRLLVGPEPEFRIESGKNILDHVTNKT